jgi:hypothetical protein
MASPNLIPYCTLWLGRPTATQASIDSIDKWHVRGHVQHNGGVPIPFEVQHDHESFQIGHGGPRFYFKDWNKMK